MRTRFKKIINSSRYVQLSGNSTYWWVKVTLYVHVITIYLAQIRLYVSRIIIQDCYKYRNWHYKYAFIMNIIGTACWFKWTHTQLSAEESHCLAAVSIIKSAGCHHNIAMASELDSFANFQLNRMPVRAWKMNYKFWTEQI